MYRDIKQGGLKKIDVGLFALNEYNEKNALLEIDDSDVVTEKEFYLKVRTMQSNFRKRLIRQLKICPITQISYNKLLIASHIKRLCFSSNNERLDILNGFVFSTLYDKLFDQGLLTFSSDKKCNYLLCFLTK